MIDFNESYQFSFPTIIRFGKGVVNELGEHLISVGKEKPLFVTDPFLKELPILIELVEKLKKEGLQCEVFSEIGQNPVKSNVENGVAYYKDKRCDSIIGFGGGASMDVARAVALMVNHSGDLFDYEDAIGGDKKIVNKIPYFVTVPTTSGTGSEVGRSSVISDDNTHEKKILFHPSLLANRVFADPELTMNLPAHITAATGMDALTHNIEAYLSKGFHPMADGIALEGIRLVGESLEKAVNAPDLEARSKMMAAALMGAVAFQKGLGVVHSCAHSLSTHFDLHHGLANAVMLAYGVEFNADVVPKKIATICSVLGLSDGKIDTFVNYIFKLNDSIKIPNKLSALKITEDDIEKLSDVAFKDACHPYNPKIVTQDNFREIFRRAL
jgi:alcohol dehydrogenase class IV